MLLPILPLGKRRGFRFQTADIRANQATTSTRHFI